MKKLLVLFLSGLLLFSFVGCGDDRQELSNGKIEQLEFSSYYQSYKYFDYVEPLLKQYFESVQKAYYKSDKKDLTTFKLDSAGESAADQLMSRYKKENNLISSNDREEKLKFLNMYIPYLDVGEKIAEIELMVSMSDTDGKFTVDVDLEQPEMFVELKDKIDDAIKQYKNGNGD